MKKILALLLALLMLAALCACGEKPAEEELQPEDAPETAVDATDADADVAAVDDSDGDVYVLTDDMIELDQGEAIEVDEEKFAAAESCIGEPVEALIAAIGEPEDTNYASSCLEVGAEDGELFYDSYGFYVWTLKTDAGETVQAVVEN